MLCGGTSRRMGTDKALITIDGVAMARRVSDALLAGGAERVVAVGGDANALAALGLHVIADEWPGQGPLGGVVTALGAAGDDAEVVAVLGCDLRSPSPVSIAALVAAVGTDEATDAAVPLLDGHRQFDQVAIRRSQEPRLRALFEAGVRSIHEALETLAVVGVDGLEPASLRDADTPSDLRLR